VASSVSGKPATIYFATQLLENSRLNAEAAPIQVSDWIAPIKQAGFSGVKVLMSQLLNAPRSEWEQIRATSAASTLPLAITTAYVPTNNLPDSRRLRDQVTEACHFFKFGAMKIHIGSVSRAQASVAQVREGVDFVKSWMQELPGDLTILVDNHGGTYMDKPEELRRTRMELGNRAKLLLRPFGMSDRALKTRLDADKDIIHLYIHFVKDGVNIPLAEDPVRTQSTIKTVMSSTFQGSWAVEFVKGAKGTPASQLFECAADNLRFMQKRLTLPL
jgi:hypothetical protein